MKVHIIISVLLDVHDATTFVDAVRQISWACHCVLIVVGVATMGLFLRAYCELYEVYEKLSLVCIDDVCVGLRA